MLKVLRKKNQVVVSGVNLKFKKVKDDEGVGRVKTLQQEHPIHISNVSLIDPELNVPCRTKVGYLEDGTKVRVSKKTGAIVPKPDRSNMTYVMRAKDYKPGPQDTAADQVMKKTYAGEDWLSVYQEFEDYLQEKANLEHKLVFDEEHTAKT